MDIALTACHIDMTDEQKFYMKKRPIYCPVTLDKEKNDFVTEINLSFPEDTILFKALSNDQTKSIDDVVDKLVTRVVKCKEIRF